MQLRRDPLSRASCNLSDGCWRTEKSWRKTFQPSLPTLPNVPMRSMCIRGQRAQSRGEPALRQKHCNTSPIASRRWQRGECQGTRARGEDQRIRGSRLRRICLVSIRKKNGCTLCSLKFFFVALRIQLPYAPPAPPEGGRGFVYPCTSTFVCTAQIKTYSVHLTSYETQ